LSYANQPSCECMHSALHTSRLVEPAQILAGTLAERHDRDMD